MDETSNSAISYPESPIDQLVKRLMVPLEFAGIKISDDDQVIYKPLQFEQLLSDALAGINRCLDLKLLLDDLYAADANQKLQTYQQELDSQRENIEKVDEAEIYATRDSTAIADWIQHGTFNRSIPGGFPENGSMGYRDALVEIVRYAQNMYDGGKQGIGMGNAHISALNAGISALQLMEREASNERRYRSELAMQARRERIREHSELFRKTRANYIENGRLKYESRIKLLVDNVLAPSLIDIRQKCEQASAGIKRVFDYDIDPLPKCDVDIIESHAGWIRARVNEITKISHLDQGFSFVLSITPSKQDLEVGALTFCLDNTNFPNHSYVRIRGVCAFIESDRQNAQFRLKISLPQWAMYIDSRRKKLVPSSQELIPPCFLGRCASRMALRAPEVGATTTWINTSPIGATAESHWRIDIEPVTSGETAKISEIQVELQLVGRPYLVHES